MNKIIIDNFDISTFSNLLKESLKTNNSSLMLQVKDGMIKSASFSKTKSLIKLWQIPLNKLILQESELETVDIDQNYLDSLDFNFYILKGDTFIKMLDVFLYKESLVNLEFNVIDNQATTLKLSGKTDQQYFIETTFPLTKEEIIIDKIDDYSEIISECTPSPDMFEFFLTKEYINNIKKLVKNLHQASVDNSAYLSFSVSKTSIKIFDKVFDIDLPNLQNKGFDDNKVLNFNILKSDFGLIGEHNYNVSTDNESQKVIFNGTFAKSIVCCLCTKPSHNQLTIESDEDDVLSSFDPSLYNFDEY